MRQINLTLRQNRHILQRQRHPLQGRADFVAEHHPCRFLHGPGLCVHSPPGHFVGAAGNVFHRLNLRVLGDFIHAL